MVSRIIWICRLEMLISRNAVIWIADSLSLRPVYLSIHSISARIRLRSLDVMIEHLKEIIFSTRKYSGHSPSDCLNGTMPTTSVIHRIAGATGSICTTQFAQILRLRCNHGTARQLHQNICGGPSWNGQMGAGECCGSVAVAPHQQTPPPPRREQ